MTAIITYQLRLDEPAIFTALDGDPNSSVSYPYIPGSVIRGMVIGLFIKSKGKGFTLDASDNNHRALFFAPSVRYLNAYPVMEIEKGNPARSLPVPATWMKPKYKIGNEADDVITDNAFQRSEQGKPKGIDGFTVISGNIAHVYQPARVINVHTARARRQAGEQQVFRYEALAEGQPFMGVILCDTAEQAAELLKLLPKNSHIALGGSRTAGYGSATMVEVKREDQWQEIEPKPVWSESLNEITLTFLSDALVNDEHGVFSPSPKTLETHLLERFGIECKVEPLSLKTTWVGGFNRKWGLPLPQMMAIERGSVVKLTGIKASPANVQKLVEDGIGARREDGFGRVALNWQRSTQATLTYQKYTPQSQDIPLSDESKALLTFIRQRTRDHLLEERIAGIVYDKHYTIYGSISRTQLSRLRTEIANELGKKTPQKTVLSRFLTQISGKKAGRQFDNARLGSEPLSQWLANPNFEGLSPNITGKDQYILQLVDYVLERAYRERDTQIEQGAD